MKANLFYFFQQARRNPYQIIAGFISLINGYWHKMKFLFLHKDIKIGKWFRVYGTFRVIGPGKIIVGNNCCIQSKLFKPVAFLTATKEAIIDIGENVSFNGTTIHCTNRIVIKNLCLIADTYIVDSQGHSLNSNRRFIYEKDITSEPVILEKNVWISDKVTIHKGVIIGENSVVGSCSLVRNSIPPNNFFAGIPAKYIKDID